MSSIKEILELVRAKEISPEEGRRRLLEVREQHARSAANGATALAKGKAVIAHRPIESDDPLARDHMVHGLPLLPAAAHLALVHGALTEIFGDVPLALSRVVFLRPFFVADREELQIAIMSDGDGRYRYEVRNTREGTPEIHSRGEIALMGPQGRKPDMRPARLDLDAIRDRCPGRVGRRDHYHRFEEKDIAYGPFYSTVEEIRHNGTEVLATLVHRHHGQGLSSCFDGAIQAIAALDASRTGQGPQVPFAMHEIQFWRTVPDQAYAWARIPPNGGGSPECELVIADPDGKVCVRLDGLVTRELRAPFGAEKLDPVRGSPGTAQALSECIAEMLGREQADIDPDKPFSEYGVDSIILVNLVTAINDRLGIDLKTTALFDHPTLGELVRFVDDEFGSRERERERQLPEELPSITPKQPELPSTRPSHVAAGPEVSVAADILSRHRIAVVGLSCRFAGARSAQEFWRNLAAGKCSIREVPKERWDVEVLYDSDPHSPGKTNCRWGGFVDDIDAFDPLFFNLSGKEAELTDPQQRLFIEECWRALEDAGYAGDAAAGLRCGVFAGVPGSDYAALLHAAGADEDAQAMMGNDTAILPARISYFLNLKGPSLAINTACSSSLVAIDMACRSIETGQCEMALAGGVCLFVTPSFYVSSSKAGMLSPDGLCKAFDRSANGFVPGDGVGVVVLKALEQAERDGDHIYGVILGSEANQDGKTNGITAPSAASQTAVQIAAYERAGISPETIQLIEAHGTGTKLGDPIEIEALARSFATYSDRKGFCAIGSVKTNIGHTGQAAGVAGLIKILLALEHELIPPTLHLSEENERIEFRKTPFYPVTSPEPWLRADGRPRRAAISSFGYSGTNAHVVVEEAPRRPASRVDRGPELILVSGKTSEALAQRLEDLDGWLAGAGSDADLTDIAYTLHVGRKHWNERAAFVVNSLSELKDAVRRARANGAPAPVSPRLTAAEKGELAAGLRRSAGAASSPEARLAWLQELADLYVRGMAFEADLLFPDGKGRRLSMPAYPFARERYWVTAAGLPATVARPVPAAPPAATSAARRHPLLSQDVPDGFLFKPASDAFVTTDHVVAGKPLLAAMVSLEMARAAVAQSAGVVVTKIRDPRWSRPLRADASEGLLLRLTRQGDDFAFELDETSSRSGCTRAPGASGLLTAGGGPPVLGQLDLDALRRRCTSSLTGAACYGRFREIGFDYGPGFRVIADMAMNEDEVIARLELPERLLASASEFVLHPALLDGALQAMIGLARGETALSVPCAASEVTVAGALPPRCIAHVRRTGEDTVDVRVADEAGRVMVAIRDLAVARAPAVARGRSKLVAFHPVWRARARSEAQEGSSEPTLVLEGDHGKVASRLRASHPSLALTVAVPGPRFLAGRNGAFEIDPARAEDWSRLLDAMGAVPRRVLVTWNMGEKPDIADSPDLTLGFATILHVAQGLMKTRPTQPVSIAVAVPVHGHDLPPHVAALGAFARSLRAEHPDIRVVVVRLPAAQLADHADTLLAEAESDDAVEVWYAEDGSRWVRELEPTPLPESAAGNGATVPIRSGGVYVVTGGLGGVGFVVARYLASRKAKLLLVGRAELDAGREARLAELMHLGAEVLYQRADVSDPDAVAFALAAARRHLGAIHGIVHAAGVTKDALLLHKRLSDARDVLAPKVDGSLWLDRLTREDPLDFFALFSSAVAVTGNAGQADYAFANAFLGELSHTRERLRLLGKRAGKTIAIDWGPWGRGMQASPDTLALLRARDVTPIDDAEGVAGFERALAFAGPEIVILAGPDLSGGSLALACAPRQAKPSRGISSTAPSIGLQREAEKYLKELLAMELRIPPERIDGAEPLEIYGIDSIMVMRLSRRLDTDFGELPKTLFFEYQNLRDLSEYLVERHRERVERLVGREALHEEEPFTTRLETRAIVPTVSAELATSEALGSPRPGPKESSTDPAIAIVGVAGRYPMADDLDAFWRNLADGRDCIVEIPHDRWGLTNFFRTEKGVRGRSYSKWGGFLRDIDKFDPLFFHVSPLEADMMAPEERLFLETVWQLLESSGYTRRSLRDRKTGVFVGVMYGHYQFFSSTDGRVGISSHASVANRVSYFFDFRGPSIALDTMCSSSLTALHLACESIFRGQCEVAVAGGVNVSIHPRKYLQLSLGQFASADGRCRSFGEGGDGYVPGEGVGAILLKPLAKALSDGDTIHALIRGTAINHGGKTNGYTVPNPHAQAAAIAEALAKAGIPADHVSYVEAHGTGTALGDPIEIAALTKAYSGSGELARQTPVGSVKSSIGHLESAAGIAAITKVLLQMRHGMLAPSIHADRLNPNIDFASAPFFVQRELAPWNRPTMTVDGDVRTVPRIAGVSSFGAGGANAHVILEEWIESAPASAGEEESSRAELIVLSAKDAPRLLALAGEIGGQLIGSTRDDGRAMSDATGAEAPSWRARLEADLRDRVGRLIDVPASQIGLDEDLQDCGLDGFALLQLGQELAQEYGLAEPPAVESIAALAAALAARRGSAPESRFGDRSGPGPVVGSTGSSLRLCDIAYTLMVGREPMEERVAFVARDVADAGRILRAVARGETPAGVFRGRLQVGEPSSSVFEGTGGREYLAALVREGALDRVAQHWLEGAAIDWNSMHPQSGGRARRVPLPTQAFARERHWLPVMLGDVELPSEEAAPASLAATPPSTPGAADRPSHGMTGATHPRNSTRTRLMQELVAMAAPLLGLAPERMDAKTTFGDYGFESLALKDLAGRISETFGVTVQPTIFFERPNLDAIATWLLDEHEARVREHCGRSGGDASIPASEAVAPTVVALPEARIEADVDQEEIAIIGMSGRFAGSPTLRDFWRNLEEGRDLVTEIPGERWNWRDYDNDDLPAQERCKSRWGSFIDDVDKFDPLFFGISPAEAGVMDPQARVFLETVWHTIEDAGYRASELSGKNVGLFAGVQFSDYQHLMHEANFLNAQAGIGNEHSILLNRISYLLDLRGPSEPVNTACSSSLVAVHRAVRSLRSGESSIAVAGGIALNLAPHSTVAAGMMGLLSPDGKCKTLDRSANGYVKGEGVAAVLLKPLRQAVRDGDHVYAVIRGTAVNHGGRAASLTAPNPEAQAALVVSAIEEAGIPHDTIGYIELHGTGTELGDPIEINGLHSAFRQLTKRRGTPAPATPHCGLGSVKTNIGHLEPASGIAGMIKVILAMRHETLPATLHLHEVNPYVDLEDGRFYVVDRKMPWPRLRDASGNWLPLRAGVSSFGFGGVNAHVVLEEFAPRQRPEQAPMSLADPATTQEEEDREHLLVFSARTEEALERVVRATLARIVDWQEEGVLPRLADVAYTLQLGREAHKERLACIARSHDHLRSQLEQHLAGRGGNGVHRGRSAGGVGDFTDAKRLSTLAEHWVAGGRVEWGLLHAGRERTRVPLPGYAFGRKRYWFHEGPIAARPGRPSPARPEVVDAPNDAASENQAGAICEGEEYVRAELRAILLEKLKIDDRELDDDMTLTDFGVDSMLGAMIMQAAQEKFGRQIPLRAAADYPSVRALAKYIHDECFDGTEVSGGTATKRGAAPAPPAATSKKVVKFPPELLPMNMKGSKPPSFWVHGATGYSVWFQNLSDWLGPDYPVYAFQARGTDGRSMPHTLDEMVGHYIECIRMVQPKGPYIIGGYSFGGLPAMEMARRLAEQGEEIEHLILFDTYPATQEVFQRHFGPYDEEFLPLYLANFAIDIDENPDSVIRKPDIAHVPGRLLVNELARMVKVRANKRMSVEDIYLYLRGGLLASENAEGIYQLYQMRPYDASDVLFFRAMDGFTGRASEKYWPPTNILKGYDYIQPWRDIVEVDADGKSSGRKLKVVELDNDHMNMLEEPTLSMAGREIQQLLRRPPAFDLEEYVRFSEAFDEVSRFGHQLLADQMRAVLPPPPESTTRQEIHEKLKVQPGTTRLSNANIDILEREGYLRGEGGRLTVTERLAEPLFAGGAVEIGRRAEELQTQFPATKDYVPLLTTCQAAVLDVIDGSRDPVDVIFPGGSMSLVAELYKGNLQTDYYNRTVADRVGEFVQRRLRRYEHAVVQLLEVGAGTGSTTAFIFEAIQQYGAKVRFIYTDVSPAFVHTGKQQFACRFSFAEFTTFDVEKPGDPQGFEPCSMDVVIASNVLHTTRRIDNTLAQCRRLLKPKGIIIINELTRRLDYNTLTFGLTPGWWLYEDEERRIGGSPLLKNHDWAGMLEKTGFESVEVTGIPGIPADELAQSVIVATAAD